MAVIAGRSGRKGRGGSEVQSVKSGRQFPNPLISDFDFSKSSRSDLPKSKKSPPGDGSTDASADAFLAKLSAMLGDKTAAAGEGSEEEIVLPTAPEGAWNVESFGAEEPIARKTIVNGILLRYQSVSAFARDPNFVVGQGSGSGKASQSQKDGTKRNTRDRDELRSWAHLIDLGLDRHGDAWLDTAVGEHAVRRLLAVEHVLIAARGDKPLAFAAAWKVALHIEGRAPGQLSGPPTLYTAVNKAVRASSLAIKSSSQSGSSRQDSDSE